VARSSLGDARGGLRQSAHHAELAYLTNLVPKLEAGVALLARTGEHKLLPAAAAPTCWARRNL